MPKSRKPRDPFIDIAATRLTPLGEIRVRPMFGGHGVYADGLFFALIDRGKLYFKVDDKTFPAYHARGIALFRPLPDRPDMVIRYCEVPPDIFGGPELIEWAEAAIAVARRAREPRAGKARRAWSRL